MGLDGIEGAYPDPMLDGKWELLFSGNNLVETQTYDIEYYVGKSRSKYFYTFVCWKVGSFLGEIPSVLT